MYHYKTSIKSPIVTHHLEASLLSNLCFPVSNNISYPLKEKFLYQNINIYFVAPWCSGYHYSMILFNKAWTTVLHRFISCSRRVPESRWWGSLTVVPAGNKAKRLLSVNHTTKTIHHQHQRRSQIKVRSCFALFFILSKSGVIWDYYC